MKAFLLRILIVKKSQKLCLFENMGKNQKTSETFEKIRNMGMNLRNGFYGKPVAWGKVNRQRLEGTMFAALS